MNGQGTFTSLNGYKYVGEYKNGNKHGQGTFIWPDLAKYVGEFKNDEINGQGSAIYPDGGKYVGEFKNGKRHGQGTLTKPEPDGTSISGKFKNDRFLKNQSKKIYTVKHNELPNTGEWKDSNRQKALEKCIEATPDWGGTNCFVVKVEYSK